MNANPQAIVIPLHFDWAQFRLKLKTTVTSRKFWLMILALIVVWGARELAPSQITLLQAVQGTIAALGLYSTGVAIEGIGAANTVAGILGAPAGQVFKAQLIRIVQVWLAARGISLDVAAIEQMLEQLVISASTTPAPKPGA